LEFRAVIASECELDLIFLFYTFSLPCPDIEPVTSLESLTT